MRQLPSFTYADWDSEAWVYLVSPTSFSLVLACTGTVFLGTGDCADLTSMH